MATPMSTIIYPPCPPLSPSSSSSPSPTSPSPSRTRTNCTPNLLPCRIRHDGPINASPRHWHVDKHTGTDNRADGEKHASSSSSSTSMAYFRGRRLRGKNVELPEGYKGLVLKRTEKMVQRRFHRGEVGRRDGVGLEDENEGENEKNDADDIDEDGDGDIDGGGLPEPEEPQTMRVLERVASFKEVMVWGHDAIPDDGDDSYIRGIQEWVGLARVMHEVESDERSE